MPCSGVQSKQVATMIVPRVAACREAFEEDKSAERTALLTGMSALRFVKYVFLGCYRCM